MTLNSSPICVVVDQPVHRRMKRLAVLRGEFAERLGAALDAERPEPVRPGAPCRASARRAIRRSGARAWKSTCAVRSASPGIGEGIDLAMRPHRLEGRTGALLGMAVIDQQRCAALVRPAARRSRRRSPRPPGRFRSACLRAASRRASGTAASIGRGPATQTNFSPSGTTTSSRQPASVLSNCRIGKASRNSLATSSIGPSIGTRDRSSWNCACGHRLELHLLERGRGLRRNALRARGRSASSPAAHRAPACRARARARRNAPARSRPARIHMSASHSPISSPNIWLISGAVMKSPASPSGSALGVIARVGLGHVVRQADRPGPGDQPAEGSASGARPALSPSRGHALSGLDPAPEASGGRRSAQTITPMPARISGIDSHWPMLSPVRMREFGQLRIGLAEEFDDEARAGDQRGKDADQHAGAEPRARLPEQRQHDRRSTARLRAAPRRAGSGGAASRPAAGKDHRPGHVASTGRPHSSPLMKLAMRPNIMPNGDVDRDVVGHADEGELVAPADPGDRQQHADHSAVEAHSAVPQPQQVPADDLLGVKWVNSSACRFRRRCRTVA